MFRKLLLNLGPRAICILGPMLYLRYLWQLLRFFPDVLRTRKLIALDKEMKGVYNIAYMGKAFLIDCGFTDKIIQDGSYTFGGIKEMYVRDCYFRPIHGKLDLSKIKTAIDLGGNRGLFTVLAAKMAEKVVYVEADKKFEPVIKHHCTLNDLSNVRTYFAFIGTGGSCAARSAGVETISLEQIMQENNMATIDLLKMDIEGSEFSLLRDFDKLDKVRAIVMEIHPQYGDLSEFVSRLKNAGFVLTLCDENLAVVHTLDPNRVSFLYALRGDA